MRPRVVALVAALAVSACGESDADGVRSTVTAFRDATAARDYHRICDEVLAPSLVKSLGRIGLPCAVAVSKFLSETRKPKVAIRRIEVKGDKAEAYVRSSAAEQAPANEILGLIKTGDGWRISSLGT